MKMPSTITIIKALAGLDLVAFVVMIILTVLAKRKGQYFAIPRPNPIYTEKETDEAFKKSKRYFIAVFVCAGILIALGVCSLFVVM
jgi:hypothetical protein